MKISIIGAGSLSLGHRVLNDLMATEALHGSLISLMGPHEAQLTILEEWAKRAISRLDVKTSIVSTTDYVESCRDADFIIFLFDVGGLHSYEQDYAIASTFGIRPCIGDTLGPTGIMKGLRNLKLVEEMAESIIRWSPRAVLISYVNPMSIMMMGLDQMLPNTAIGLCGGIQSTIRTISHCLRMDQRLLRTQFAGINHMSWALEISSSGRDLYHEFKRCMLSRYWQQKEPFRAEILRYFDFFPTESSGHIKDMLPWFNSDRESSADSDIRGYSGEPGAYLKYSKFLQRSMQHIDYLKFNNGTVHPKEFDSCANIIEAYVTGNDYRFYGNVMNDGLFIKNLPKSTCVEIPLRISKSSLIADFSQKLPPQLVTLCMSNISVHDLVVKAYFNRDTQLLASAIAMDPSTLSKLSLPSIFEMTNQLVEANHGKIGDFRKQDIYQTNDSPTEPSEKERKLDHALMLLYSYRKEMAKLKQSDID